MFINRRGRSYAGIQAGLGPQSEYFATTTHIISIVEVQDFSGCGLQKMPLKPGTRHHLHLPLPSSRSVRISVGYFLGLDYFSLPYQRFDNYWTSNQSPTEKSSFSVKKLFLPLSYDIMNFLLLCFIRNITLKKISTVQSY